MKMRRTLMMLLGLALTCGVVYAAAVVPSTIDQPGTQPGEVTNLQPLNRCDNCHAGYDAAVEPVFTWQGSMMASAGRDPIFWATVAVAEQDLDGAGDLCLRCHAKAGWIAGRSTPTDGSALAPADSDGVECDLCHRMTNPDNSEHLGVMNAPFIANDGTAGYYAGGMTSLWPWGDKLGPYANATARHRWMESKFHRSVDFCGTCHDVSNPGVGNLAHNFGAQKLFLTTEQVTADGSITEDPKNYTNKAAFNNQPYRYGIVERTFSEYKAGLISQTLVRDYLTLPADLQGGALEAAYTAALAAGRGGDYEDGTPRYFSCQTCHLRPVTGRGATGNPPLRKDLPWHDMTGGNYWMPDAIQYLDSLGKLRLGGGLTPLQIDALHAGRQRAMTQLELAASLALEANTLKVINHTGHKLISGYPEGRRMWLNIKWYDGAGLLLREDGQYGPLAVNWDVNGDGVVDGNDTVDSLVDLHDANTRIYETHYGMTQEWAAQLVAINPAYGELALSYDRFSGEPDFLLSQLADAVPGTKHESLHFVLNNIVKTDSRIPPYGMDYETARLRNALPVPEDQFNGGPGQTYDYFDTFALQPPLGAATASIDLLYQPTSYEYQLFLLKANRGTNPFLAEEGANMFEAWLNTDMAFPYVMASATWHDPGLPDCTAGIPDQAPAVPGDARVDLAWSVVANPVDGYRIYRGQLGQMQLVYDTVNAANPLATGYTDPFLINGQEYCYQVTSYNTDPVSGIACESDFSNLQCATPASSATATVGISMLETGTGTGLMFVPAGVFNVGDNVVIRAYVVDGDGVPLPEALVDIRITGPDPDTVTVAQLTSAQSDIDGIAEASWQTAGQRRRQPRTAPGIYTATVINVTAAGHTWDGVEAALVFEIK